MAAATTCPDKKFSLKANCFEIEIPYIVASFSEDSTTASLACASVNIFTTKSACYCSHALHYHQFKYRLYFRLHMHCNQVEEQFLRLLLMAVSLHPFAVLVRTVLSSTNALTNIAVFD